MADIQSFKIETPKNLDAIFSLECFKYLEMKGLFKQIFEYLTKVGLKLGDIDAKLNSIPNFDAVTKAIKDPLMKAYLKSTFALSNGDMPHRMKF